ncbi:hypothetical protein IEQ34_010677 [Dendrobium chrysotoxum]|uniref:Uncharacterized protein n=1 Tax=Dendrobium chrysotoxum TaxID=161865 RepID=A0AAV7GW46_DENCH|nr:hypothetical protein IEQ34_010677 [Dendrobium chrysotoxum]
MVNIVVLRPHGLAAATAAVAVVLCRAGFHSEENETACPFHHNPTRPSLPHVISQFPSYFLNKALPASTTSSPNTCSLNPNPSIFSFHLSLPPSLRSSKTLAASPSITLLSSHSFPLNAALVDSKNLHITSALLPNPNPSPSPSSSPSLNTTKSGSISLTALKNANPALPALNCAHTTTLSSSPTRLLSTISPLSTIKSTSIDFAYRINGGPKSYPSGANPNGPFDTASTTVSFTIDGGPPGRRVSASSIVGH